MNEKTELTFEDKVKMAAAKRLDEMPEIKKKLEKKVKTFGQMFKENLAKKRQEKKVKAIMRQKSMFGITKMKLITQIDEIVKRIGEDKINPIVLGNIMRSGKNKLNYYKQKLEHYERVLKKYPKKVFKMNKNVGLREIKQYKKKVK